MIKSIRTADTKNKRVLVRVDFNVPIENGKVADDTRIMATLPTIRYLIDDNAKVILVTHLGRPGGKKVAELKLDPVADFLSEILGKKVLKSDESVGPTVKKAIDEMNFGDVILLENIRFHKEEENNDPEFAKQLADLADTYIVDSFGTSHRKHASTYGVSKHIPAYAGFLMEKEVLTLTELMKNTPRPLTLIVGGAKIDTKIGVIKNFLNKADYFLIGGGLANTFLAAQGYNMGKSLFEPEKIELAREIMMAAEMFRDKFILPEDAIVSDKAEKNTKILDLPVTDIEGDMMVLDLGVKSREKFAEVIAMSKTIIWNGPMGLYEKEPFEKGTLYIAQAVSEATQAKTIIGGGDTIDAIKNFKIRLNKFTHVSTGGGAMLEFLEGSPLPGVEIIMG